MNEEDKQQLLNLITYRVVQNPERAPIQVRVISDESFAKTYGTDATAHVAITIPKSEERRFNEGVL